MSVAPDATVPLDLAVVRAADGRQLIGLTVPAHSASGQGNSQMMYLYANQTDQAYSTVAQLRASGIGTWLGQDRDGTQDYAVLVPDGVTRVRLDAPGEPLAHRARECRRIPPVKRQRHQPLQATGYDVA